MSDDEDVLFEAFDVGLLNKKAKNVADILHTPEDRRLIKTLFLCGAFMSVGLCIAVLGPTLPFLESQTGSTPSQIVYVFLGRGFGYFIGSIMTGCMFEMLNPLMFIGICLATCTFSLCFIPTASDVSLVMFLFVFIGLAMGSLDTGANVVCLRLWGKRSPPFMQALHFSFAVGALLAPLMVKPFLTTELTRNSRNEDFNTTETITILYNATLSTEISTTDGPLSTTEFITTGSFAQSTDNIITTEESMSTSIGSSVQLTANITTAEEPMSTNTSSSEQLTANITTAEGPMSINTSSSEQLTANITTAEGPMSINTSSSEQLTDNITTAEEPMSTILTVTTLGGGDDNKITNIYYIIAAFVAFNSLAFFYFSWSSPKKKMHTQLSASVSGTSFSSRFNQQMLSIMFVFYFLYVGAEMAFGSFIFSYAIDSKLGMSEDEASLLNSSFWISFAMFRAIAICCASYFPPYYLLVADMIGCIASSVLLLFFGSTHSYALWFGTIFLGASMASLFPTGLSWLEQYLTVTGKAAAMLVIGAAAGEMVIPFLVGQYFQEDSDKGNDDMLMYIMAAISVALPLLFYAANTIAVNNAEKCLHNKKPEKKAMLSQANVEAAITQARKPKMHKNGKTITFSSKKHSE
ncbi:sodium-dependent glucose transporter 1A-like isoform X2 [Antedon mediterranea]